MKVNKLMQTTMEISTKKGEKKGIFSSYYRKKVPNSYAK